jgi:ABC-type nitrate/sulfonate/bicarbonate transport system substrate-binding protein
MNMAAPLVVALDGGAPIVVLAGVHVGCFELIATDRVRTIKDLKGKTVAVFVWSLPSTCSWRAWRRWWVSIRARTLPG